MSERLIWLLSVVLVLCCANGTLAELVAQWKFNNDTTDSVGSLDWTLEGGAGYSPDSKEGRYSLSLDGMDDYAVQPGVGILANAFSTKTVVLWFKADANNVTQVLFDEGGVMDGLGIRVNMRYLQAAARSGGTKVVASARLGGRGWIHAVVAFDNGLLRVYVNGVEQASASGSFSTIATHANRAAIGARDTGDAFGEIGTGGYFGGLIDDVQIYDNVLSADEIKELAAGRPATVGVKSEREKPRTEPEKTEAPEVPFHPEPSYGGYVKQGTYLGLYGIRNSMSGDFDDSRIYGSFLLGELLGAPNINDGTGFGVVLGTRFPEGAFEFGYERSSHDTNSSRGFGESEATYNVIDFNFKIDVFAQDRTRPYILFGFGIPWLTIENDLFDTYDGSWDDATYLGFALNAGGGVAYYFHPQWAVTAGLIYRWNWFTSAEGGDLDKNLLENVFTLNIGIAYTF